MAIDAATRKELSELLGEGVGFDVPLSRHTSLRVGGPTDALARPGSVEALAEVAELCREREIPLLPIGAGFNLLVRDAGFRGVCVQLHALREVSLLSSGSLRVAAGVRHSSVSRFCLEAGRGGLEFGVGIPGTLGGWVAMNAGTRERELGDVVESVCVLEPGSRHPRELEPSEVGFRYRGTALPPGSLVVSAKLRTHEEDPARIRERTQELLAERRRSQPVDRLSCGSVFTNPPGDHAGRLIEAAGLKGHRIGDAQISTVHANFIVNLGSARAQDVLALIDLARERVRAHAGLELETEVRIEGEPA